MAHKNAYDNHVEKLVKCLPMDDAHFVTTLSAQKLLPGDTENNIKYLSTQAEKASYFLSHVIKPALDIDDTSNFEKLLTIMQSCGYNHVEKLANTIEFEIDGKKSNVSDPDQILTLGSIPKRESESEMAEYITDLMVIYGEGSTAPQGYTKIELDLSTGAGGEYVYLCYKKSSSGAPITGLNVFADKSSEFAIQNGYTKVHGDLNKGASGKYVYVCYSRDQSLPPIRDVTAISGDRRVIYPSSKYVRINQDCNEGAKGKYIYICYHQPRS